MKHKSGFGAGFIFFAAITWDKAKKAIANALLAVL